MWGGQEQGGKEKNLGNVRVATIFGDVFFAWGVTIRTCLFYFFVPCPCRSGVIALVCVCWSWEVVGLSMLVLCPVVACLFVGCSI